MDTAGEGDLIVDPTVDPLGEKTDPFRTVAGGVTGADSLVCCAWLCDGSEVVEANRFDSETLDRR